MALMLRQQLQEAGIKLKIIPYDNEETLLSKRFITQHMPNARLRLFPSLIQDVIAEWSSLKPKIINRLWVYKNKEVDRLFTLAEITNDVEKRRNIHQKIYSIISKDQPACFLYFPYQFHGISSKFENTENFFTLFMPFYTIKDWYLKERR
jgi:ABC-type transport system substrate-binding protein